MTVKWKHHLELRVISPILVPRLLKPDRKRKAGVGLFFGGRAWRHAAGTFFIG
jgi:hypothetical protein